MTTSGRRIEVAFERYVSAREYLIANGYASEINWQATRHLSAVTESDFLREAAWVIINSGMREAVVRRKFPAIERAFDGFQSSVFIVDNYRQCIKKARSAFDHPKKIRAVVGVAFRIAMDGFATVKAATAQYGPEYLASFDFIGPITSKHFAKNLGIPVSKADRHLVRVASILRFRNASSLCLTLSRLSGDSVAVVDIVIWRFATLRSDYKEWFSEIGTFTGAGCVDDADSKDDVQC